MAKKRVKERKGKKPKRKRKKKLKSTLYALEGEALKRKGKFCPKCGAGVFLAEHKERLACGKCGFMQKK